MNERIKELALKAFQPINDMASEGIADRGTFDQAWFQLYNQKFAELIVRECVDVCLDRHDTWRWDDELDSDSGPRDCVRSIKQHFGVEE